MMRCVPVLLFTLLVLLAAAFGRQKLTKQPGGIKPTSVNSKTQPAMKHPSLQKASMRDVPSKGVPPCRSIENADSGAPSGVYTIYTKYRQAIQVYCEMGLNGGGFTFIHPMYLPWLKNEELLSLFTDNTSFLLRVRHTNGSQPYAVLGQLSEYASVPLRLGLNDYTDYSMPANSLVIGEPFLYFGFLPNSYSTTRQVQGLAVNGFRAAYDHSDGVGASHIALFANFKEIAPVTTYMPGPMMTYILSNLWSNPSGRVMPSDFFMFGEIHFGGDGCYVQTNQMANVLGFAIGFR